MPHFLSIARVRVPESRVPEYLALVTELARRSAGRGAHLWLFRHPADPTRFVEFSESRDAAAHRSAPRHAAEDLELEARLRRLGDYESGADEIWEEVELG